MYFIGFLVVDSRRQPVIEMESEPFKGGFPRLEFRTILGPVAHYLLEHRVNGDGVLGSGNIGFPTWQRLVQADEGDAAE